MNLHPRSSDQQRQIERLTQHLAKSSAPKMSGSGEENELNRSLDHPSSNQHPATFTQDIERENNQLSLQGIDIDIVRHRYPFSLVWTPIPLITWIIPVIGHLGICDSRGIIYDFGGPYYVSEDCMTFGQPLKYWQVDLAPVIQNDLLHGNKQEAVAMIHSWDDAVQSASVTYRQRMHNLFCDNCHSHVAMALNLAKLGDKNRGFWTMATVFFYFTWYSHYTRPSSIVQVWLPFLIMTAIIVIIVVFAGGYYK